MKAYSILTSSALGAGLIVSLGIGAAAQTVYSRSARDTLRYREVNSADVTVSAPQGELAVSMKQDAIVGLRFLPGDRAEAWFDSLAVSLSLPTGETTPPTASMLRQPYTLGFDARGRTRLLSAPAMSAEVRQAGDLRGQFDDFFLRLPQAPLRPGLTWTDTVTFADSTADGTVQRSVVGLYRVERDSTVRGERAFVVSLAQQMKVHSTQIQPGTGQSESTMTGSADGFYLFAPASGRMLARRRSGSLDGNVTVVTPVGPLTAKQSMKYANSVDALK